MNSQLFSGEDISRANHKGYCVGDTVWIKPEDAGDIKAKIIGFTHPSVEDRPIVKFKYAGKTMKIAIDYNRVSPYRKGKVKPVYIRII